MRPHDPAAGAAYMTFAVISMVFIDVSANALVDRYPLQQVMFFRGFFALLPLTIVLLLRREIGQLRVGSVGIHLLRGACGIAATASFFAALRYMTLVDATA
ncbi:MAG: hypothetical protein K0U93_09960, partial [Gammaproteobacteria bacterium]|nr:hypothetical protein [Gammaproteobacteria bacterium]